MYFILRTFATADISVIMLLVRARSRSPSPRNVSKSSRKSDNEASLKEKAEKVEKAEKSEKESEKMTEKAASILLPSCTVHLLFVDFFLESHLSSL